MDKGYNIPLEVLVKQRLEDDTWWIEYVGLFTIFRVPANIREANRSLYEPRMVSIGPYNYHLRKDRLRTMEDQKWRLLRSFLYRNNELSVDCCIKAVRGIEKTARQHYSEFVFLGQDEFVQMLLLDGCFVLELFFKWLNEDPDVLFKEGWGPTTILSDLLLFENQIPFCVIEKLYDMIMIGEAGGENNRDTFLTLLAKFLMDEEPSHTSPVTWPDKIDHLLDLYHQFLIEPGLAQEENKHDPAALPLWKQRLKHWITPRPDQRGAKRPPRQIPCATELREVGVKFRKKQSPKSLFDVNFSGGILEIPPLQIDSNKKALLTNLVALEKHKTWGDQTVTSYVTLMDSLINTKEDVALLQSAGVVHNMLSSHQEAAVFFNRLGEGTSVDAMNHHFTRLFRRVQLYYDSNWNRSWARLIHDYFNSPWAFISVIAGVILLALSALQTFYTVYPYYRPKS